MQLKYQTNLSEVLGKAKGFRPQGAASKERSNYRNSYHSGWVLAVLATLLMAATQFQDSAPQAPQVRGASSWAVPAVGVQLPVSVRPLVAVLARFGFEPRELGARKAALRARAWGILKALVRALGREFRGLATLQVGC